jgi:hypothetical protein
MRMLDDPASEPLYCFSGARIRMADIVIALRDRQPSHVVHATFSILSFNDEGCLIAREFDRHQGALVDIALSAVVGRPERHSNVLDASSRFISRGATWTPSRALGRRLHDAALDRARYHRL